jgi:hypothetical protein
MNLSHNFILNYLFMKAVGGSNVLALFLAFVDLIYRITVANQEDAAFVDPSLGGCP